ncbi:MAG: hypothetical protein KBC48_00750 [Candidatus Pacebacteria bacterium]|nr:hypothetical protein [Candidatus Paceibacterota bacterium]
MKTRLVSLMMVMLLVLTPAWADTDPLAPIWQGLQKIEKITVKQAAKETLQALVANNPTVFIKMMKKTFSKAEDRTLPGYKVFKTEAVSTPAIAGEYGERPILYVAINPRDLSDRQWGILIFPGTANERFLGWYTWEI